MAIIIAWNLLFVAARADVPALRVLADVEQTGRLVSLESSAKNAPGRFVIVAPLPPKMAAPILIADCTKDQENFAARLGLIRVEATASHEYQVNVIGDSSSSARLYCKTPAGWQCLTSQESSWSLTMDKSGVMDLGISVVLPEAKADARNPNWPTSFTMEFTSKSAPKVATRVPVRVAPFIIPSPLDPVDEMIIVAQEATGAAVKSLTAFADRTQIKLTIHTANPPADQWMQDTIEPGVFAFPVGATTNQARGALTGIRKRFWNSSAALDREIIDRLQRDHVVTITAGAARTNTRWIDWYGNLEVTPPHTDRQGRSFPYGRVITGKQRDLAMHPGVMKFLEAQRLQWPPIVVDTSWLMIGHVDEAVNFVPAKTARGYKVLIPSPSAARKLLDDLIAQGLGDAPVFENTHAATTVIQLRQQTAASDENRTVDAKIADLRRQLQSEFGLDDTDFVMVPVLFERGGAVIPNAVNSLVVNGYVVAPEPRGPRRASKDLFEEAIRTALVSCDAQIVFVDAWQAYHVMGGEIHCGTNAFRRLRDPAWWRHEVKRIH